jgi:hypothetical protein
MSFPIFTEDIAQLRAFDEGTTSTNEALLGVLRDTEMYDEREMLMILFAYRRVHGYPVATTKALGLGDDPATVADWLCSRQPDALAEVLKAIDSGYSRQILALAMRKFATHVATASRGEIHQFTFDEVLLDLLVDARGGGLD